MNKIDPPTKNLCKKERFSNLLLLAKPRLFIALANYVSSDEMGGNKKRLMMTMGGKAVINPWAKCFIRYFGWRDAPSIWIGRNSKKNCVAFLRHFPVEQCACARLGTTKEECAKKF